MHKLAKVILGISGGIAAYKIPFLIRLFKKKQIDVQVVATHNALRFVTPLTLEILSQSKIYNDIFSRPEKYETQHISITDTADAMIIAPATANVIAKIAHGIADDALTTTYLSFNKTVFIAPAMNTRMLTHPATIENLNKLKSRGNKIIEPESGSLACGDSGKGRMAEPETIFRFVIDYFQKQQYLKSKKVLITAGPTLEPIDPIRYISNYSTGKMGFALAETFNNVGADVILVSGPVNLQPPADITVESVLTASEMYYACLKYFDKCDIIIMAAAVADYTPENLATNKIKKNNQPLTITLKQTIDILSELGKRKQKHQILVGFALETENHLENAKNKLFQKNADCIILNPLDKDSGFSVDTNKITCLTRNKIQHYPLMSKRLAAEEIVHFIINNFITTENKPK